MAIFNTSHINIITKFHPCTYSVLDPTAYGTAKILVLIVVTAGNDIL
jgi:hypothetical protein